MLLKNKLVMFFILLLLVTGGAMYMFQPGGLLTKNADSIEIEDQTFTKIDIKTDNAAIKLVPTKDTKVTANYTGKAKKSTKIIFTADVKNDTLIIQLKEKRRGFIHFGYTSLDLLVTVNVPEKQFDRIVAESDNGKILVENINAEEVFLETDNGGIQLKNSIVKRLNAETDNGAITLDHVDGEINAETDNGKISLITTHLDRTISLSTDNGSIEVHTEEMPKDATINAKTDLGKITIFDDMDKNVVFGKGSNQIKLKTDNGRITVVK